MGKDQNKLDSILAKSKEGRILLQKDITFLLGLKDNKQISRLFQTARHLRRKHFGNAIFLYGFIYASTYCRNDCRFCFFRRSNAESRRYRKVTPEIVTAARGLADTGVHLIDLTMGEDPALFNVRGAGFDRRKLRPVKPLWALQIGLNFSCGQKFISKKYNEPYTSNSNRQAN